MTNNLRGRIYPMNAMQWEMYEEWSEDPTMTQYNLTVCVDVPRSKCSSDRMLSACQAVLDAQRYFHIHLILDAEGVPQVCEDAAMPATVHCQEMSDEECGAATGSATTLWLILQRLHRPLTATSISIAHSAHWARMFTL